MVACMTLHNFIRDHDLDDSDFELDVGDSRATPIQPSVGEGTVLGNETDMCVLRDAIAAPLVT
jgi:hypothetical protein